MKPTLHGGAPRRAPINDNPYFAPMPPLSIARAAADEARLARDVLLHMIQRGSIDFARNGHARLTMPLRRDVMEFLFALGAMDEDREDDTPREEEPDREDEGLDEDGDALEEDHRDHFGSARRYVAQPGAISMSMIRSKGAEA